MRAALIVLASAALWGVGPTLASEPTPTPAEPQPPVPQSAVPEVPVVPEEPAPRVSYFRPRELPPPPAPRAEPGRRAAEEPPHEAGHVAATQASRRGRRWFALPVLFWLPETRLGFGATGGLHVDVDGAPRASSFFAAAVYTLERQGSLDVAGDVYLRGGALLSGRMRLVHFPDVFYGIGPHTTSAQREEFTRHGAEAVITAELPIVSHLRAGPRLDLRVEGIRDRRPGGSLAAGTVTGWDGYSAAALGGTVSWDTRDSAFWPTRGNLTEAWYVHAPGGIGRSHGFGRGVLEARQFLPLGEGRVLGLDGYVEGADGDPPFTLLPTLGSTRFLRGIREGRFRDRIDWAAQAELRLPVHGRLAATTFLGAGAVAAGLRELSLRTAQLAGGAGLRFRLTDDGANIRLDVAASRMGIAVYVLMLEAF